MGDVQNALFRALTKRSPKSEQRDVPTRAGQLVKRLGSIAQAAKAAACAPSTFRRWLKGESMPKPENADKLNRANRESMVPDGRRRRVSQAGNDAAPPAERWAHKTPGQGGVVITAHIKVSEDERERTINIAQYLSSYELENLTGAFFRGDEDAARSIIQGAVSQYKPGAVMTYLSNINFTPAQWEAGGEEE
jgi:hypothetical protein